MFLLGLILLLLGSHQNLTINQATKVRTLTPMTLVERAMVVRVSLRIAKVDVTLLKDALVFQKTLLFAIDQGQLFDFFLQAHQGVQVLANGFRDAPSFDLLVALGAAHECKRDLKRGPSVFEQVNDAVRVEHVAAAKLRAGLTS